MDAQELQEYILRTHNKPMVEMGFIELHMALEALNQELIKTYYARELDKYEEEQDRYDAEQGLDEIL